MKEGTISSPSPLPTTKETPLPQPTLSGRCDLSQFILQTVFKNKC